jgi:hypothetical protein
MDGWKLAPSGEGAHLIERGNVRGRERLAQFDREETPRFYPQPTENTANSGAAHRRLHAATSDAGVNIRGSAISDSELLLRYEAAYRSADLAGIRGMLRTPDGSVVLGTNLTPHEAYLLLLNWGGL